MRHWEIYRPAMSEEAIRWNQQHDAIMDEFLQRQREAEMEERITKRVIDAFTVKVLNSASPEIEKIKNEIANMFSK